MPGPKKSSAKKIKIAEDTAKALDLRRAGLRIRDIANKLGRSASWVQLAITSFCERHPIEKLNEYRTHEIERQEEIIATHWAKRSDPKSAKVIQDSSKLLMQLKGAGGAHTVELQGALAITDGAHDALLSNLARLAAAVGAGEGDPPPGESGGT